MNQEFVPLKPNLTEQSNFDVYRLEGITPDATNGCLFKVKF